MEDIWKELPRDMVHEILNKTKWASVSEATCDNYLLASRVGAFGPNRFFKMETISTFTEFQKGTLDTV